MKSDKTVICPKCGGTIVTRHVTPEGIESDFIDEKGRCFSCHKEAKMPRKKKTDTDERDPKVVAAANAMNGDQPHADEDPNEPSNRKSIGYDHCPPEVAQMIDDAMAKWHPELVEAKVEIRPLFALAYSRSGEAIPAIKIRGHAVLAKIKITSLEDRVRGLGDAKLLIDGARWDRLGHNAKLALLDHELEHLEVDEEKLDDAGRPKLKMKHHDWELAGFDSVMKRQGENSIELQNVALLKERFAQLLIPFPDQPSASV